MGTTKVQLLDCTLRDGGYYNAWDFDHGLILDYLSAMKQAGVELVELGFRSPKSLTFLGATAHTSDRFIETLDVPEGLRIGVMMNAKDIVDADGAPEEVIASLFVNSSDSQVAFVRFASGVGEYALISPAVSSLKRLGYEVGVNLMQVHNLEDSQIEQFGQWCTDHSVDFCYFADSFGSLEPLDVQRITKVLQSVFSGVIGCHLHDNKSLATANVLAAVDVNIDLVDVTVTGMGRGPGNAKTEYVGPLLASKGLIDFNLDPVIELVEEHFAPLCDRYRWGTNAFYMLSALGNVHPSYAQRLLTDKRMNPVGVADSIRRLGVEGGSSFSLDKAASFEMNDMGEATGTWDATGSVPSGRAILLGPGEGLQRQRRYIEDFLTCAHRPTTFNLNLSSLVDPQLVDFFVALSLARSRIDSPSFEGSGKLISPHRELSGWSVEDPPRVLNYGARLEKSRFHASQMGCVLPHALTAAYALAVAVAGGAHVVYLAGFDGYEVGDSRHVEMDEVFRQFEISYPGVELVSLTPTRYQIRSTSVFAISP